MPSIWPRSRSPGCSGRLVRLEVRPLQLAVGLGQIGEFSFVLASAAVAAGAIDEVLVHGDHRGRRGEHRRQLDRGPRCRARRPGERRAPPSDAPSASTRTRPARPPSPGPPPAASGRRASRAVGRSRVRLRRRYVIALSGPSGWALDPILGVAVDDHQVERVDARLLVGVAPGDPGARPRPALLELADVPVLAVGQVPEADRVRRVEAGRGDRRRLEQPVADDPASGPGPAGSSRWTSR